MMNHLLRTIACLTVLAWCLTACAPVEKPVEVPEKASISVAGFHQPQSSRELLAGYMDEGAELVGPEAIATLDEMLSRELRARWEGLFYNQALTRQCRELVLQESGDERLSALKFWVRVGRCVPVDYLVVPQVLVWKERKGGEWGSEDPARVVLDLYLVDVGKGELVQRFHFDERQQSLAEDVFSIKRFFRREGKWVTAEQLAREAIVSGLEELGL